MNRIEFPKASFVNKIIAKDLLYKKVTVPEKVKDVFTAQVERIRCLYELTSGNTNLNHTTQVPKILIVQLTLKGEELNADICATIDKAFSVPVIFEIISPEGAYYKASYRRRNEADNSQWVLSSYFQSALFSNEEKSPLPVVLSLESLYHKLLQVIIPHRLLQDESIYDLVVRSEYIEKMQKQAAQLKKHVDREKQYNRRVELNKKHKVLVAALNELMSV